jgi:hypothetical protein
MAGEMVIGNLPVTGRMADMARKSDSAKHVANLRTRRRAAGLVQNTVWSMPTDKDLLKAVEKGALAGEDGASVLRRELQLRPVDRPETLEALARTREQILELERELAKAVEDEKTVKASKIILEAENQEITAALDNIKSKYREKQKELTILNEEINNERNKGIFTIIKERIFKNV